MADLELTRSGRMLVDGEGAQGKRGELVVAAGTSREVRLATVERGDGYKWLRPGSYACEFGWWTTGSGRRFKAIRVLGDYSRGRIYIHPANWPHQLQGCIAPGLAETRDGVGPSRAAMLAIFDALGGWVEGRSLSLRVA